MTLIDIHAHMDFKDFDSDREELVKKLKENNIITVSNTINKENYLYTKELYKGQNHIKVIPGLYPQEAEKITDPEFEEYLNYLKKNEKEYVAIGEVGLDAYNTTDEKLLELQEMRFRKLIELGIKLDKPVIIHTRKREQRVLEILREYVEKYNFRKFDLHCFMGKKKLIKDIKELKIYCSIPLIVLNTQSFQLLVMELPISQLLVETDSPYLNPSKQRNSPLNIPHIYEKIAQLKGYDKIEVENIIYRNFQQLLL